MKFLVAADLYGSPFMFTTFGTYKFKTTFGGILSLITLGLIILFSFLFGEDFYFRTNPKVIQQIVSPPNYEQIKVNNNNFTLMWRVDNSEFLPVKYEDNFYVVVSYTSRSVNNETNQLWEDYTVLFDRVSCLTLKDTLHPSSKIYNLSDW